MATRCDADRLRALLHRHRGSTLQSDALDSFCGSRDWRQPLHFLVEHEGLDVVLHRKEQDNDIVSVHIGLGPPIPHFEDTFSEFTRVRIRREKRLYCKMCGHENGEPDPTTPGRLLRIFVQRVLPVDQWKGTDADNFECLCIACREGMGKFKRRSPGILPLKKQLNRSSPRVQIEVLEWLAARYPGHARGFLAAFGRSER